MNLFLDKLSEDYAIPRETLDTAWVKAEYHLCYKEKVLPEDFTKAHIAAIHKSVKEQTGIAEIEKKVLDEVFGKAL